MSSKTPPWRQFDFTLRLLIARLLVFVLCLAVHSFAIDRDSFDSSAENDEQHESVKFLPSTATNELRKNAKALSTFPVAYEEGDAVDRFVLVERMHCLGVVHVYKEEKEHTSEESALVLSEYTGGVDELLLSAAEEHLLLSDTPAFDTDSSAAFNVDGNAALENLSAFERCGVRKSSFCLDQHIFRGGHGETWKAHLISSSEESASTSEGFVLKRMIVRNRPDILHCATREIFFGTLLQGQLEFSRFLSFFVTSLPVDTDAARDETSNREQRTIQKQMVLRQEQRDNGETVDEPQVFPSISASAADEVWLVFHDEGPSLQALLYAEQRANSRRTSTTVLLSPSLSWRKLRQSPSVTRALLRQLIEHVAKLHALGIVHRDIKPGNLLLRRTNDEEEDPDEVTLVVADFSSAILLENWTNENVSADVELYPPGGPTVREETLPYAPPEVLLSLCVDDEEALLGMEKESHMKSKHEEQKVLLCSSVAFDENVPQSYDIWSIGVVFLEMIVGTANVFDLDERTARILALQLAKRDVFDPRVLRRAELLTVLAEFGLWSPSVNPRSMWFHGSGDIESNNHHRNHREKRAGHEILSEDYVDAMLIYLSTVPSLSLCRQIPSGSKLLRICEKSSASFGLFGEELDLDLDHDRAQSLLAAAIRRRDPLGQGLSDKRALDLLSKLLHFNPARRMPLIDALDHTFFASAR